MAWTQSDVASTMALLVSIGSLYVAWRGQRRAIRSERPIFWVDRPFSSASNGDWHHISICLRNRMPHNVKCERIEILSPRRAVIADYWESTHFVDGKGRVLKTDLQASSSRWIGMRLAATHAGKERGPRSNIIVHGVGDVDDEDFVVHCAPLFKSWAFLSRRPIKLSMRIIWRSKDESSLKQTTIVHTELLPPIVVASIR
jgi:hypothetical protein